MLVIYVSGYIKFLLFPFCYYPTIFPCFQLLSVLHFYTYCSNFVIDKSFDHFSLKMFTALYINKKYLASDPNNHFTASIFFVSFNHFFYMTFKIIMKSKHICSLFFCFVLFFLLFLKFTYSEKAKKFKEISLLVLTLIIMSNLALGRFFQIFVAF